MKKRVLIVSFVALVLVAAFLWYQKISLNHLASYTNTQYGYSLYYPKSFSLNAKDPKAVTIGTVSFEPGPGALFINLQEDSALFDQSRADSSQKCDEVNIAQQKATRCVGPDAFGGGAESMYIIPFGKFFLSLSYIHSDSKIDEQMEEIIKSLEIKK